MAFMTPKEFITEVQRSADTKNQALNAADVSRVISQAFLVLGSLSIEEQLVLIARLYAHSRVINPGKIRRPKNKVAKKKAAKKTSAKKPAKKKAAKKTKKAS